MHTFTLLGFILAIPDNWTPANSVTLFACLVSLITVITSVVSQWLQIRNGRDITIKQINAATRDTMLKLRAEYLVKDRQSWAKEFRETVGEILFLGDPDSDSNPALRRVERRVKITQLALKLDLMLPHSQKHGAMMMAATHLSNGVLSQAGERATMERLEHSRALTEAARAILAEETAELKRQLSAEVAL